MNSLLFFFALFFFCALYVFIGWRASKGQKTNDDYFLMGRKLTFFPLCMTLLATQVGGGSFIGAAEEAYRYGWAVLIYPLGSAIGLCLLGAGFGARLRQLNIATMAELFEKVYSSPNLRALASALSIIALYLALVGQGIAARKFFMTLGIESDWLFAFFWMGFVAYTVMGGLKAVVETDVLQALLILAAVVALWLSIDLSWLQQTKGSPSAVDAPLALPSSAISWFLMPLLFMLIEQDMGQRCFAAKKPSTVAPAAIGSAFLLFICSSVAIAIGVIAKSQNLSNGAGASVLVTTVTSLFSPWVAGFFIAAIFMAIASTADSLLCSIGSNITYDFLLQNRTKAQATIRSSRAITLFTGLSALALVYLFDHILNMMIWGYSFCVCAVFVSTIAAVLSKTPSRAGAYGSVVLGGVSFMVVRIVTFVLPEQESLFLELLPLVLSAVGYVAFYFLEKKLNQEAAYERLPF